MCGCLVVGIFVLRSSTVCTLCVSGHDNVKLGDIYFFANVSITLFIRFITAVVLFAAVHTACLFVYWQHYVAITKFYNIKQKKLKRDCFNLKNNITKNYNRKFIVVNIYDNL